MNFLYVCQSVSWLSFLLKLCQYKDSSSSGTDIFLNIFRHIPWIVPESLKMIPKSFIHLSVCFLAYFLIEINTGTSPVLVEISFSTFWRHFWNVFTINQNHYDFLVCLSVC